MMKQPDADGRYPLSGHEYYSIQQLFGIVSSFEKAMSRLKERAALKPGTWRDMKMISAVGSKTITSLLSTVPIKKLKQIRIELNNTEVKAEVKGGGDGLPSHKNTEFCYTPEAAVDLLIQNALEWQCLFCEKSTKEAKKCPYRVAIDACFPYERPGGTPELCKYSGYSLEVENEQPE